MKKILFLVFMYLIISPMISPLKAQQREEYFRMTLTTAGIPYNDGKIKFTVPKPIKVNEYIQSVEDKKYIWLHNVQTAQHYESSGLNVFIPIGREKLEFLRNSPELQSGEITIDSFHNYYVNGIRIEKLIEEDRQRKMIARNKVFIRLDRTN